MNEEHLRTYLDDHHAGSRAAVELIEHYLRTHRGSSRARVLQEVLDEIRQDQAVLLDLLRRVGGRGSRLKDAAAWVLEKLSRLKLNEVGKHRTLSEFEKMEQLVLGVSGKHALWVALQTVTSADGRFRDVDFGRLQQRAQRQLEAVEHQRLEAARAAFLTESGAGST
jgi:hypothetical protein